MSDLAVIGYGPRGQQWADVARDAGFSQVFAVDPSPAARRVAEERGCVPVEHVDGLPPVDLAIVATPPAHHADAASLAMARAERLLIEKPVSLSSAGASRIREEAERNATNVRVIQNFRARPLEGAIATAIDGAGPIRRATTVVSRPLTGVPAHDASVEDGILWDFAVHFVDLQVMRFGGLPDHVRTVASEVDELPSYLCVFTWPDGRTWTLQIADSPAIYSSFELLESSTSAVRVLDSRVHVIERGRRPRRIRVRRRGRSEVDIMREMLTGESAGLVTVEDAAGVVAAIESIVRSMQTGSARASCAEETGQP